MPERLHCSRAKVGVVTRSGHSEWRLGVATRSGDPARLRMLRTSFTLWAQSESLVVDANPEMRILPEICPNHVRTLWPEAARLSGAAGKRAGRIPALVPAAGHVGMLAHSRGDIAKQRLGVGEASAPLRWQRWQVRQHSCKRCHRRTPCGHYSAARPRTVAGLSDRYDAIARH